MELKILDPSFSYIGVLDIFESVIWTERFNEFGDFEVYTPVTLEALAKLESDRYLSIDDSEHIMIIENRQIITDSDGPNKLKVTGRSLQSLLDRRIVWGQRMITSSLQAAIETLLNENIINPVDVNRQISNFLFVASLDTNITSLQVDAQWAGENLYTVITTLCKKHHIGFKIILNEGMFEFSLYSGEDRSYEQTANPYVVFSPEFDNLLSSEYTESNIDLKTVALIAGEGEWAVREATMASTGPTVGLDRREMFVDANDITSIVDEVELTLTEYLSQLEQRGIERLGSKIEIETFDAKIDSTVMYTYGTDYNMGDIVQIVNEYDMESRSRVTEFIRSQSLTGYEVYPTFTKVID